MGKVVSCFLSLLPPEDRTCHAHPFSPVSDDLGDIIH